MIASVREGQKRPTIQRRPSRRKADYLADPLRPFTPSPSPLAIVSERHGDMVPLLHVPHQEIRYPLAVRNASSWTFLYVGPQYGEWTSDGSAHRAQNWTRAPKLDPVNPTGTTNTKVDRRLATVRAIWRLKTVKWVEILDGGILESRQKQVSARLRPWFLQK